MALKCVTCGLLFRSRNELDWHIRQEHLQQRLPPTKDSRRRPRLRPRTGGEQVALSTALRKWYDHDQSASRSSASAIVPSLRTPSGRRRCST
jgi:uncharacterized C2H2 Zn-finger protein